MKKKFKVGFTYLGPSSHIPHSLPIALELSQHSDFEVNIFVSGSINENVIESFITDDNKNNVNLIKLKPTFIHSLLRRCKKRMHYRVANVINNNKQLLLTQDVFVVTELEHIISSKSKKPLHILADHGAGDGIYGYSKSLQKADYILAAGKEKKERIINAQNITAEKIAIVGYPKFDFTSSNTSKPLRKLFNNNNPTILYNPHFKVQGSFQQWGEDILEYFFQNKQYNLIFAPHILLFSKGKRKIRQEYFNAENIHIDIDSESMSLIDMTYTKQADIYIGDISSQIYEFIAYKKRPCIFLNAHNVNWKNDPSFRMWHMGEVINSKEELSKAITDADSKHSNYQTVQEKMINKTFSITGNLPSSRAVKAIVEFMHTSKSNIKS